MDAASYAVERNRNLQDNVQKIIQMMLMGKQNKQEQDWRQGQFDYRKEQDTINQGQQNRALERQDAQQKRYEEYQQSLAQHYANMDEAARNKPVKVEPTLDDKKAEWEAQATINEKHRRPPTPPKPQGKSALAERYEQFKQIAAEMKMTPEQANAEWSKYLLGKNSGGGSSAFGDLEAGQVETGEPAPPNSEGKIFTKNGVRAKSVGGFLIPIK